MNKGSITIVSATPTAPQLPPGFQLDAAPPPAPANSPPASPGLPAGFQFDAPQPQSIGDQLSAGFTSGVRALPIVGEPLLSGLENLKAAVQGRSPQDVAASDQAQVEQNPVASTVGTVAGNVLPFAIGGEIPAVAKVLGMDSAVPMLARSLASGGTQAAISGADSFARGGSPEQIAQDAAFGGVTGLVAPGAGDLIAKGAGKLATGARQVIDAAVNPDRAASTLVGKVAQNDANLGRAMTPTDEATAALNGQPVVNADRYGEGVRNLARTAANSDPTAQQTLGDLMQQRFTTQSQRAADFVNRITGGATNDVALQEAIDRGARQANSANYGKAYADPRAQAIWTPGIKQLFQSPDFINAIRGAERTAANDAATTGVKAVRNPFVFDSQGNIALRQGPGGAVSLPNLPFWDVVQRNLRAASERAYNGGDKLLGSQLGDLRTALLGELDKTVPSFAAARRGAAGFFGAEDALDAGKKFAMTKGNLPEARKAYAQFSPAERKAFAVGFASELIDKIGAVRDKVNVIDQVFGSPAARAQVELALGKNAAAQLEHFVRIEDIMNMTRQAVSGNSTTARQLLASGALGGLGGGFVGSGMSFNPLDWNMQSVASGATFLALGRLGARALGQKFEQKVMQRVADMLISSDPKALQNAVKSATWSPAFKAAIRALEVGLQGTVRAGQTAMSRPAPINITVSGGNESTSGTSP
jgi:hypothetical protein